MQCLLKEFGITKDPPQSNYKMAGTCILGSRRGEWDLIRVMEDCTSRVYVTKKYQKGQIMIEKMLMFATVKFL